MFFSFLALHKTQNYSQGKCIILEISLYWKISRPISFQNWKGHLIMGPNAIIIQPM